MLLCDLSSQIIPSNSSRKEASEVVEQVWVLRGDVVGVGGEGKNIKIVFS